MKIRNVKRWAPRPLVSFAIGVAGGVIAFGVRFALHQLLQGHFAFVFFTVAALVVEYFAGLWPALFVVAGGLLLGSYFFVPPYNILLIPEPQDVVFIGGYLMASLVGITLIESLQRSRYEARLLKEVAQSRLEMLERSNAERLRAEQAARLSEERYQALVASSAPQLWYMRRLDGHFEYVNDRFYQYTGLAPGSLEENGWWKTIHPEDVERVQRQWNAVAQTGEGASCGFRLRMLIRGRIRPFDTRHNEATGFAA